jgi:serine/threonine-protein kinase
VRPGDEEVRLSEKIEPVPFETVWSELGLGDQPRPIPLDKTITGRTWSDLDPGERPQGNGLGGRITVRILAASPAPPEPFDSQVTAPDSHDVQATHPVQRNCPRLPDAISLHTLPRISLTAPGAPSGRHATPDSDPARRSDLEIVDILGEGGMGRVHLARQRSLSRDVAVKVVKPEAQDDTSVEALLSEAVIMGFLEHPSIIPVHALGLDDAGQPILVMKRVEGVVWRDLIENPGHPAWARLETMAEDRLGVHLEILLQVANALAFAHSRGIVHLDVKPANVMVGDFGEVYLLDWGVATGIERTARPARHALRGTPAYMAPEMVSPRAGMIDERTDVYLLGTTLHVALTGRSRHEGRTLLDVLGAAYASRPFAYDASVPAELAAICNRATHADRGRRYPSIPAFRQAIQDYLRHRGSIALSATAATLLTALKAALAAKGEEAGVFDAERAYRLMTECRFGFMQALRAWKDNAAACDGLERCIEVMIEHHIAEGSVSAARGLLGELPAPRPDLKKKIDALEEEQRKRREEEERLKHMARDFDLTVAARQRTAILFALGAAVLVAVLTWMASTGAEAPTHQRMITVACLLLVAVTIAVAIGRRHLFRNTANRRIVALLYTVLGALLVHRIIAASRGMLPSMVLLDDMLMLSALMAAGSVMLLRWLGWVSLLFGAGVVFSVLRPELGATAFSVAAILAFFVGVARLKRRRA